MFPVWWSRPSSVNTTSKSNVLGITRTPPPNDVKWLHRQCKDPKSDFGPTLNKRQINRKDLSQLLLSVIQVEKITIHS